MDVGTVNFEDGSLFYYWRGRVRWVGQAAGEVSEIGGEVNLAGTAGELYGKGVGTCFDDHGVDVDVSGKGGSVCGDEGDPGFTIEEVGINNGF
jgi:hypothetical protein